MANPDIKKFIDFFHDAALKVRQIKPKFVHGKDGRLVKLALEKLSLRQLEQLTLWFLEKKKTLATTIGAMLGKSVLDTLQDDMRKPGFWKELDKIYEKYFLAGAQVATKKLAEKLQPFTHKQITEIQEEISRLVRSKRM